MFHVLDHSHLVYSGELSDATRYVMERSGKRLDEAIRTGIRILYSDAWIQLPMLGSFAPQPARTKTGGQP